MKIKGKRSLYIFAGLAYAFRSLPVYCAAFLVFCLMAGQEYAAAVARLGQVAVPFVLTGAAKGYAAYMLHLEREASPDADQTAQKKQYLNLFKLIFALCIAYLFAAAFLLK